MSRLFFDICEGGTLYVDDEGRDCATEADVESYVMRIVTGLLGAEVAMANHAQEGVIEVRDRLDRIERTYRYAFLVTDLGRPSVQV